MIGAYVEVRPPTRFNKGMLNGYILCENGCWHWAGAELKPGNYGRIKIGDRKILAHRFMYELTKGPVPSGLQLDHLCRNRACVNPDHLEPVTSRTNTLRGKTPAAENAAKTHCIHGHAYTEANTYWSWDDGRYRRVCRACRRRIEANGRLAKGAKPR